MKAYLLTRVFIVVLVCNGALPQELQTSAPDSNSATTSSSSSSSSSTTTTMTTTTTTSATTTTTSATTTTTSATTTTTTASPIAKVTTSKNNLIGNEHDIHNASIGVEPATPLIEPKTSDITTQYPTQSTEFPTFPDWLVTGPPLWENPYPKIPFITDDNNHHTFPKKPTSRKKFLGPLRRILRRFSERLSTRLENLSNKVQRKGVNKPRKVFKRKFRMLIERFLRRHPLARGAYHVLKLPENIVAYFRPKNAIKRAVSNIISYASDVAHDPVRRQDDGIFRTLLHRLSRILKAINYNRPKNVRKRVIGVPIKWKWTMGPPDSTQFYVVNEGNATTSTGLQKIEEDVVCDRLGCFEENPKNVNVTELKKHKQGDIIMCSGLECVEIQVS